MKILYVSTISNTIHAFMIPHIEMLIQKGHTVDIACNMVQAADEKLLEMGCRYFNIDFQRNPICTQNSSAFKALKKLIQDEKYDLVHTHTPVASVCVRFACKNLPDTKVFYTAHGFHFYKGAPLKNWLMYYPMEKFLSRYTDLLITINKEDYEFALKSLKAKNTIFMPGVGINIEKMNSIQIDKAAKKAELGIPAENLVVLSVGELIPRKNYGTALRAVANMKTNGVTYVICGAGIKKVRADG